MPVSIVNTAHFNTPGLSIPTTAFVVGTEVGVPTGTSLTTRTSLGSPTSTGSYELVDPTGRQSSATVDVDIFEAIEFTTNPLIVHRTTGNVRLFRNCRFAILNETRMMECDEEGYQTATYMAPRTIVDHCTFDGQSTSSRALQGGNAWLVDSHVVGCADGWGGPFCSVVANSNIIADTVIGGFDIHADGIQFAGIGKSVVWHSYVNGGDVVGSASQAIRVGCEYGANDDIYIAWCNIDAGAGGYSLQCRGDLLAPAIGITNIRCHDNIIKPAGFGPVDFEYAETALWERNYSDFEGGTPIADPGT